MNWDLTEALAYYRTQGAPGDQTALVSLLREIQQNSGGSVPLYALETAAAAYGIKASLLQAIIKRIPSLRLGDTHELVLCAGPNCGRHTAIAKAAEQIRNEKITVKFVPCMRQCGKGPNIRWDGKLYHQADEALICELTRRKDENDEK